MRTENKEAQVADEREKFNRPVGKDDDVEGHKFEPTDQEKFQVDEDEDVEGHKFEPAGEKYASDEGEDVEGHKF